MTIPSPLPVGSLPGIPSTGPGAPGAPGSPADPAGPANPAGTQTKPGSAAGLFPTVNPSPSTIGKAGASRVADTSALPEGAAIVNAQLAGLAALALAFVLAVTRVSIRRPANQAEQAKPAEQPNQAEQPNTESGQNTEPGNKPKPGA
jgi:hypothetical protein